MDVPWHSIMLCSATWCIASRAPSSASTATGMMVFFNDPLSRDDEPPSRAVQKAVAMRNRVDQLAEGWHRRGYDLHFAAGIAQGHADRRPDLASLRARWDYAAIGMVTNLAARLCAEAAPGQILVSQKVHAAVEPIVSAESIGELTLRGFARPTRAYNVRGAGRRPESRYRVSSPTTSRA